MSKRADAHIHLFEGGYRDSFANRDGVEIDEIACYETLMADHNIDAALVVCFADAEWCAGNNAFVASQRNAHPWIRPVAFVDPSQSLSVDQLEQFREQGFVGLSMYIFDTARQGALRSIDGACWQWLIDHRWLISVNSKGEAWGAWRAVLDRFGELRVVISHLGLPPAVAQASADMAERIADVTALADYSGPRVKLSGFYAMTDPGHDYPHETAWPYVEALREAYGVSRLLWASDFSPCLDSLSFPQTMDLFAKMPFFSDADCDRILGDNLLSLLDEVV